MLWSNKSKPRIESETLVIEGPPEVLVQLRRSLRARQLSLRVSRLDGRVTLTIPKSTPRKEAIRFLNERTQWIRKHLADVVPERLPSIGDQILFQGQQHRIETHPLKAARIEAQKILVPQGDARQTAARIEALLKREARHHLQRASAFYAEQVGRDFQRLTLRDTRSRWGSCSSAGNLMYSWRLIMAPLDVLEYVAAHEVSHLVHMDHSPAFWNQVGEICPDYKHLRKWLRENASQLHQYTFRQ